MKRISVCVATVFAGLFLLALPATADDRELLRDATGDPYVFVIMDTSGSMNWTTACTEDDATSDIDPWDGMCTQECILDDADCAKVCPDYGCLEYVQGEDATDPIEIIIDNDDPTLVSTSGTWLSRSDDDFVGGEFIYNDSGTASITYTINVPEDGEYHVYQQWQGRGYYAEDVKVTIAHADDTQYLEVNQQDGDAHNVYNFLGTYRFENGVPGSVTLSNVDRRFGGGISADALRLYRLPPPASQACKAGSEGYRCQQPLCPQGDCVAKFGVDDPFSKFYQAKSALYEVIEEVPDVNWGFGTYEQDNGRVRFKHYQYKVNAVKSNGDAQPYIDFDGMDWPEVGSTEVFGTGPRPGDGLASYGTNGRGDEYLWNCVSPAVTRNDTNASFDDDQIIGCLGDEPGDLKDIWEVDRLRRIPKLGRTATYDTFIYLRDTDGVTYRIEYENIPAEPISWGDEYINVRLIATECLTEQCFYTGEYSTTTTTIEVEYQLVSEYHEWSGRVQRHPMQANGFFHFQSSPFADNDCNGMEENNDWDNNISSGPNYPLYTSHAGDDAWWGYTFKWPWEQDSRGEKNIDGVDFEDDDGLTENRVDFFDRGDFIPLDWATTNDMVVLRHLAPNSVSVDGVTGEYVFTGDTPDFRTSSYFLDTYDEFENESRRRLKLRDSDERPLMAYGSTPLAASLESFSEWYKGKEDCRFDLGDDLTTNDVPCGWKDYAEIYDLDWSCRDKFVLFLTDGDETCAPSVTDACVVTGNLFNQERVRTFVVGFGLPDSGDALGCMASDGGTGEPLLPRNKEELVEALRAIVLQVKTESRAFASASIPTVQRTASDQIVFASFTPIPAEAFWPGRIDIFRQPLPLTDSQQPDVDKECSEDLQSGCHLWDLGEQILSQAPEEDDVIGTSTPDYRIGTGIDNRRVLYGMENPLNERPGPLRLLIPPKDGDYGDALAHRDDMASVLVPADDYADYLAGSLTTAALDDKLQFTVGETLRIKEVDIQLQVVVLDENGEAETITVEAACTGGSEHVPCRYVMGDIFHAQPQVLASPADFNFFQEDLCGRPQTRGTPTNCVPADEFDSAADMRDRGYREFVRRGGWKRRMLTAATNDGQIHFFDAGTFESIEDDVLGTVELYNDGTGKELFSYMPRMVMPIVRDQANGVRHIYSMDGSPRLSDVFIDPMPDEVTGNLLPEQREWRSVLVGGLREAGDVFDQTNDVQGFTGGYWALDITRPDALEDADDRDSRFDPYRPADPGNFTPDCMALDATTGEQTVVADCTTITDPPVPVPFPMEMWNFQDKVEVSYLGQRFAVDEEVGLLDADADGLHDGGYPNSFVPNSRADLGETWSNPVIGPIVVCEGTSCDYTDVENGSADDLTVKWVAIFGGGLDSAFKASPNSGYWLYMVDIETGEAIYKRQLQGAAPSDPAAYDDDGDGIIDRIYIGTTEGLLYKVDLTAVNGSNEVPGMEDHTIPHTRVIGWTPTDPGDPTSVTVQRITDTAWDPFPILYADCPLYYPPTLFRIPERQQVGMAIGCGDREDLWLENGTKSRFFVVIDEDFTKASANLPIVEDDLVYLDWQTGIDSDIADEADGDLLLNATADAARPGWVMGFPNDYRTTNEAFLVSGILIFSMFEPATFNVGGGGGGGGSDAICGRDGTTYALVVSLRDGEGFGNQPGCGGRCTEVNEFTTAVHVQSSTTKNPGSGSEATQASKLDSALRDAIRQEILDQMPRTCQFNDNFEYEVSALRNSTGVNVFAGIPKVVCPGDWQN